VTVRHASDDHTADSLFGAPGDISDQWAQWDPGVPLEVLSTEYASVVDPIVEFIDARRCDGLEIVVLIPVVVPGRIRYRVLHNHLDLVLSAALRHRNDVVVARVPLGLEDLPTHQADGGPRSSRKSR